MRDASRDYEGRMECSRKVWYPLRRDAKAVARQYRYGRAYKCDWCGRYHVGAERTARNQGLVTRFGAAS